MAYLEAIRWLGANKDNLSQAWLEYNRPDAMLYILEQLGMPEKDLVLLRISMLDAPIEGGGVAWDLIPDPRLLAHITDMRDGKVDVMDNSDLSYEAGQVAGIATGKAWHRHSAGREWMVAMLQAEIPDLQVWHDNLQENE